MNDDIERLNAENNKLNNYKSPGDQSGARHSDIKTPEEDNRRSLVEGIVLDLSNQRADIDVIKMTITEIGNQVNIITQALNKIVNGQPLQAPGQPVNQNQPQQGLNIEAIGQLGDVAEKIFSAYKTIKGNPPQTQSFIDQDYINEQVKKSVMGNFEIGDALVSNLKSKLINKAVASSVSDAMKDTSHDPK